MRTALRPAGGHRISAGLGVGQARQRPGRATEGVKSEKAIFAPARGNAVEKPPAEVMSNLSHGEVSLDRPRKPEWSP
ncbi:hypothetical protein ACFPN0_00745 [Kitasatospora cinereorecta]